MLKLIINKSDYGIFKEIADKYLEYNYITINVDRLNDKLHLQIVLFNDEFLDFQEELMEKLSGAQMEEYIG